MRAVRTDFAQRRGVTSVMAIAGTSGPPFRGTSVQSKTSSGQQVLPSWHTILEGESFERARTLPVRHAAQQRSAPGGAGAVGRSPPRGATHRLIEIAALSEKFDTGPELGHPDGLSSYWQGVLNNVSFALETSAKQVQ